jgi:hypothetical protein
VSPSISPAGSHGSSVEETDATRSALLRLDKDLLVAIIQAHANHCDIAGLGHLDG